MGTRPLLPEEIAHLESELKKAREAGRLTDNYVSYLEQKLSAGTAWSMSDEDFKAMLKEVHEMVRQDNAREKRLEVECYGHVLTGKERQLRSLGVYPKRVSLD